MLKTIVPARLEFKEGVPYSSAYGDIYHSADGGQGEAQHVFLQGCGLPQAWADRASFVILETGFGTGLNFLTTWAAWRDDPRRPACLHYLSVEKHPFRQADLAALHAHWPELATLSGELLASWPGLMPGFHRIALDHGRVQLTLMLGDAHDCLPQVQARVDAFYLDGFAPSLNADLWQTELFATLAKLAHRGAMAASYTVESTVRSGLESAGFACDKRKGFGRKRHCLSARFREDGNRSVRAKPQHVAVIGAGVAGTSIAYALAQRGVSVTVLEAAHDIGQGASGNTVAVFRPLISRDDNRNSRLIRAAFLHDLRAWDALGDAVEWSRCGVLQLPRDAEAATKLRRALDETVPPEDFARWVDLDEARELANWPVSMPGAFYSTAGWLVPTSLCRAWLNHPSIQLRTACLVSSIQPDSSGWRLCGPSGEVWMEADAVVVANARDALSLLPEQMWPLETVRGQVTQLPAGSLPEIQRVIAREGYVSPGMTQPVVGATYEYGEVDIEPSLASNLENLARLATILPGAERRFEIGALSGRASLRASLPDRLPIVGAVNGYSGIYVAAGYASRGVVWAGLLAEALADQMTGQPLPLELDLMRAIDPGRYTR